MKVAALLVSAAAVATTSARVIGLAVPTTIKAGTTFPAKILTQNYIQSVQDVAMAFGFAQGDGYPGALGSGIQSFQFGSDESNTIQNVTRYIVPPTSLQNGPVSVHVSVFSLYGASSTPTLSNYNVTVTLGDETSTTFRSSYGIVGS